MTDAHRALRFMLLAATCTALGCDECERACEEDYQECIAESSREDCGDERDMCENGCRAADEQRWDWEGDGKTTY